MQETQRTQVQSLGQENSLEQEMATHSSILAWEIPWTEEPGRPHVVHRVTRLGHDLANNNTEISVNNNVPVLVH